MKPDSLADTITPKSDQLNADDLLVGPITVTVQSVKRGDPVQPVSIEIDGGRQPYKPCKSMRRVLIAAWGDKGADWVGKSMTLYCDPNVVFGGVKVGGIRISHLSHIDGDKEYLLTTAKAKRSAFKVQSLDAPKPKKPVDKYTAAEEMLRAVAADGWAGLMKRVADSKDFTTEQKATLSAIGDERGRELGLVAKETT